MSKFSEIIESLDKIIIYVDSLIENFNVNQHSAQSNCQKILEFKKNMYTTKLIFENDIINSKDVENYDSAGISFLFANSYTTNGYALTLPINFIIRNKIIQEFQTINSIIVKYLS